MLINCVAYQEGKRLDNIPVDGGEGGAIDMAVAAAKYGDLFRLLLWTGLGSALLFLLLAPLLRRMMHGVK